MHHRIRDQLLRSAATLVTTHRAGTLLACLLAAAVCVVITATSLDFQADRSALVSAELDWNRRYADYKTNYPRWSDVIVCLAGDPADRRIDELTRTVADAVRRAPFVSDADGGFLAGDAGPRLFRIAPEAEFRRRLRELEQGRWLAAAEHPNQALAIATGGLAAAARAETPGGDQLGQLDAMLQPYVAGLRGEPADFAWLRDDEETGRWQPLKSESGRIRYVQVHLAATDAADESVTTLGENLAALRAELRAIIEASDVPDVAWGVTGIPAIEADETAQSIRDTTIASIVAMLLITVLMVSVYRGVVLPLIAVGSLLVGIAWSFGWLMLTVGHLQLLSVVFTVILLGLGIDFALHLVARLELVQSEHEDLASALTRVFKGIGPGLATGAVTTAAAFGVIAFTDFQGMAEMGLIAAGGTILCLVAMVTMFPAALAATGRWKRIVRERHGGETAHFAAGRIDIVDTKPWATLVVAALVVAGLIASGSRVRYDPNVLNLHPPGIESVHWEHEIVTDDARSVWAALIPVRPERAEAMADRAHGLELVSGVGGMGMLYPPDRHDRDAAVAAVRDSAIDLPASPPGLAPLRGQLAAIRLGLDGRLASMPEADRERAREILDGLTAALTDASQLPPSIQEERWEGLLRSFTAERDRLADTVRTALAAEGPTPGDLPPTLRAQWLGRDGSWLLHVYPTADPEGRSILDPALLEPFVAQVRTVAPDVLGPPVQIYESSLLIKGEYIKAAWLAVLVIFVVLLIDFRSLTDALCAMAPVAIGFVGALGIMGLAGEPLNFANIIVMPLIFGIGVAAGVHMVHRWRVEPEGRPAGLSGGTGRGITLTMATTMIGFGCMLLAQHRGIRSLGLVMVAGLGVTLLACYGVLPALLQLRSARLRRLSPPSSPASRATPDRSRTADTTPKKPLARPASLG